MTLRLDGMRATTSVLLALLAAFLWAAGCDKNHDQDQIRDRDGDRHEEGHEHAGEQAGEHEHEHGEHEHGDHEHEPPVPAPYAGKTSPVAGGPEAIAKGKAIYLEKCAACHGPEGKGDGPATARMNFDPRPTDFTVKEHMAAMKDDFLFWRIAEGGAAEPFHSKMPPWKEKLTEEERWLTVHFLRSLSGG